MIKKNGILIIMLALLLLLSSLPNAAFAEDKEPLYVTDVQSNIDGLDSALLNSLHNINVMDSIDDNLTLDFSKSGTVGEYGYDIHFSLNGSFGALNYFNGDFSVTATIKQNGKLYTEFSSSGSATGHYDSNTKRAGITMNLGQVNGDHWSGEGLLGIILATRENIVLKDSGVRFTDLSGEVSVRHHHDRLGWEFADMDMVLYVMDHIKTHRDASAILSLTDMTTFVMKENSEIILNTESEKESAWSILYGKVLMNVKKMIKDGSMNVEMSQAVAGIKGTIFICDTGESFSRVQVIEGAVELTDLNGKKTMVEAGQQVLVQDGVTGQVGVFLIDEELKNWPEEVRKQVYAGIAERTGNKVSQNTTEEETDYKALFEKKIAEHESHVQSKSVIKYLLWVIALGGVGAGIFWFIKKRKEK